MGQAHQSEKGNQNALIYIWRKENLYHCLEHYLFLSPTFTMKHIIQGQSDNKNQLNAMLHFNNRHENPLRKPNQTKTIHTNKRKNTNTHHFWINCGNKGATSCGQTNPRRPIVIAKNTFINKKRNKFMRSEQLKHTNIAQWLPTQIC